MKLTSFPPARHNTGGKRSPLDLRKVSNIERCRSNLRQQSKPVLTQSRLRCVYHHLVEKRIDRRAQAGERGHRGFEIFGGERLARIRRNLSDRLGERLFLRFGEQFGGWRAVVGTAVLLLLDPQNVLRAADACQQIGAVVGLQEAAERFHAADDEHKIVLAR